MKRRAFQRAGITDFPQHLARFDRLASLHHDFFGVRVQGEKIPAVINDDDFSVIFEPARKHHFPLKHGVKRRAALRLNIHAVRGCVRVADAHGPEIRQNFPFHRPEQFAFVAAKIFGIGLRDLLRIFRNDDLLRGRFLTRRAGRFDGLLFQIIQKRLEFSGGTL